MDWRERLADAEGEAIMRLAGPPAELSAAEAAARELGFFCARIDGAAVPDKEALLAELAARLRFPAYFGGNWDALADCLTDLGDWIEAPGFLVVFANAGELCRSRPRDIAVLASILESAAEFWRRQVPPRPFKAIWAGN